MIVCNEPPERDLKGLVLRLGGFHNQIGFLGAIGHMVSGSGLQVPIEVVYTSNTVAHMLSVKAEARAVRGHLLVDSALNELIAAKTFTSSC